MIPLPPVYIVHLFPEERAALLGLLRSLSDEQWVREAVPGWSVKDVAAHIVADDLGRLSRGRDGYSASLFAPTSRETFEAELLEFINRQNETWVAAMRRLSPRIVTDMLERSGRDTQALFESLDPDAPGLGVSWAGEAESPNWFDLAREYTERWHHQAQVREAVAAPMLYEPRLFTPVLATFIRGVPHAFRGVGAPDGTHVRIRINGPAGGEWSLVREASLWQLVQAIGGETDAAVEIDPETAWRLFTKGMTPGEARTRASISGDEALAARVLETVSIIA